MQMGRPRIREPTTGYLLRMEIIRRLGGQCRRCGFPDWRALQVDHVNGNGRSQRQHKDSISYYRGILNNLSSGLYQVLCANCNWVKRYENGEAGSVDLVKSKE